MPNGTRKELEAGRARARRIYPGPLGPCVLCGKPAYDRHHKDDDPSNNDPANVAFLCRHCHMVVDGRMQRLHAFPRPTKPPQPCVVCGELRKPLRRGRCHACSEYWRRNGVDVRPEDRKKTHCPAGHPYDEANTYQQGNHRGCRACHRIREYARRAARPTPSWKGVARCPVCGGTFPMSSRVHQYCSRRCKGIASGRRRHSGGRVYV